MVITRDVSRGVVHGVAVLVTPGVVRVVLVTVPAELTHQLY